MGKVPRRDLVASVPVFGVWWGFKCPRLGFRFAKYTGGLLGLVY
jgi:hypothetical protein